MISVVGYYSTQFGELWERSLFDLVKESIDGLLKETKINKEEINAIFFSNMMSGILENNLHGSSKIAQLLETHIPVFRSEAACASGGMAVYLAIQYLKANPGKTVVVVGAEKMTDFAPEEAVEGLMAAASGEEQEAGLTFPGLYALLAQMYLSKYNYKHSHMGAISVKNHFHASLNEKAHFKKKVTLEQVLNSPKIAWPLGVLDCSPISDGASSIMLTSDNIKIRKANRTCSVLSSEIASDSISLTEREKLDSLMSTVVAGNKAFRAAGIKRSDIRIAELHDCFSIAEILGMEDLGFWKKGEGGARALEYETMLGNSGDIIVNTSGGLKAAGHPIGATGIKQIGEVFLQLTDQAGKRQVKNAHYGLAQNIGGSGGTAVVTILGA